MRLLSLLAIAAAFVWGQAPNLARKVSAGPNGAAVVMLRNVHDVPAMAWRYERRDGRGMSVSDSLIGPGIAPGAVTRAMDDPTDAVRWAVIYADGTTAGDPVVVEEMVGSRRDALNSIPMLRQWIMEAMDGRASFAALKDRVDAIPKRAPGTGMPVVNMAVSSVRDRLHRVDTLDKAGPELLKHLDGLRNLLEASKPPLR